MSSASQFVEAVLSDVKPTALPPAVAEIVERHRLTLLSLAQALIASGRDETEVIAILRTASESFTDRLNSQVKDNRP